MKIVKINNHYKTKTMKKIALLLSTIFLVATATAQLPSSTFLGPDQNYCPGGAGLGFNGSEPGFNSAWTYLWSTGATTQQIFFPYPTAGQYTVWCKVSLGTNSVTDTVHYNVSPAVSVPPLTSLASNNCVDSASIFTPMVSGHTYQWYRENPNQPGNYITLLGQNGNALIVTQSGVYRIKVTNSGGCFEYNTINVSTLGKPKKYLHDTAYCQTTGMPNIIMNDNLNSNCTYLWNQFNTGDEWVINPNAYQPTPLTCWVTITNANGCQTVDSVTWQAYPKPNPLLNSALYTCGDTIVLRDYDTSYSHIWKFGNNIVSTADTLAINYPGTFTVTTTNEHNCSVQNDVYVYQTQGVSVAGFNFIPNVVAAPRKFYFTAINPINAINYFWDFGDGSTSNNINPTHEYVGTDTTALVLLTVTNYTFSAQCRTETVSLLINTSGRTVTSINDIENQSGLLIYPNPVNDQLNVTLKDGIITNIVLTDLVGKSVYHNSIKSDKTSVNLNSINSGIYLLRVEVKNNKGTQVITKKINKI